MKLKNWDETHFVFNVDNGRTLGFSRTDDVKYADVVSRGEGFTFVFVLVVVVTFKLRHRF